MMLANIGALTKRALFWQFIDNSAPLISVSASRRLTSKASKLAPDRLPLSFCRVANAFNWLCGFQLFEQ